MNMANILQKPAELYPNKQALFDGSIGFSFSELEVYSTNFALSLISNGFKSGDRIVFSATKDAMQIIGIMGCLKAGGIYVPVDPTTPKSRLEYILKDIKPKYIVSTNPVHDDIAKKMAIENIEHISIKQPAETSGEPTLPDIKPDDGAYCIYTSGSTGFPKGVLIQHKNVIQFFNSFSPVMLINVGSRCLNTTALYFDVSIMDIFYPLYRAAFVYLFCGRIIANKMLTIIDDFKITNFCAVGPVLSLMAHGTKFEKSRLTSLTRIMTGAEILNVSTIQKWLAKVENLSVINGYGPTEATVICAYYVIGEIEPDRKEFYPIGKAMEGVKLLLVDDEGEIISDVNQPGELLIGGGQVMKCYWNNTAQTDISVRTINGTRYYCSGDVCQWLNDEDLYILGRKDDEVKISGHRIHLNEIKRILNGCSSVKEGYVIAVEHENLGKVLVACFNKINELQDDNDVMAFVKSILREDLPYYMVPSLYYLLDDFPKLPSGKTDKNGLSQLVLGTIKESGPCQTEFICTRPMICA